MIKIADSSSAGWATKRPYEHFDVASDDDKIIRCAEDQAKAELEKAKKTMMVLVNLVFILCAVSENNRSSGVDLPWRVTEAAVGHFAKECLVKWPNNKVTDPWVLERQQSQLPVSHQLLQASKLPPAGTESLPCQDNFDKYWNYAGRLRQNVLFWKDTIGVNEEILSVIENGYVIPFITKPPSFVMKINRSALKSKSFVESAIVLLVKNNALMRYPVFLKIHKQFIWDTKFRLGFECFNFKMMSRIVDYDYYGVSNEFFEYKEELNGPHKVYRIANYSNKKLPCYNSLYWTLNTEAVDTSLVPWGRDNNWLVPPVYLIPKALNFYFVS
ncbi:hypothetical protein MAR_017537 [Mya arenaria]|uniref:Uncharacterized protein n=1 Tax=Mya arenaria TaxID=6604 RepID=A0ABY7EGQ1_MYAAR|nr:hypothetical protein MAR_017537 [Mya arenaria]